MKKMLFKTIGISLVIFISIIFNRQIFAESYDTQPPKVNISAPSKSTISEGESITYTIKMTDNSGISAINITRADITMKGFSATITIKKTAINTNTITFSNIKNTNSTESGKYIVISKNVVVDTYNNFNSATSSPKFNIKTETTTPKPVTPNPTTPKPVTPKKDTTLPVVKISKPTKTNVNEGENISFTINFSDNKGIRSVNLKENNIKLNGFEADIKIEGTGNKTRKITLSNIKGTEGKNKYITIGSGVVIDTTGNRSKAVSSSKFTLNKEQEEVTDPNIQIIKPVTDISIIGDINKDINIFSAWLRCEKTNVSYAQENNYITEGTKTTYIIEYYNGSNQNIRDVKLQLNIPYNVTIEEITEGGNILKTQGDATIVEWELTDVKASSLARISVKVKFNENKTLKSSKSISEVFYSTLTTTADNDVTYSYLKQLFIDLTEGKTGEYKSYLTALDSTNSIRPNDEVTRAEFAKMLADSGVVPVTTGSEKYKIFKDYEKIPSYARDAVSALSDKNILQTFPDGEFKPNNPILLEDAIEMIAKASVEMSDNKLLINKPTFLYTATLVDDEKEITPKKDYVMELIRQNIIAKYEFKPDKYTLRREVVELINALTFRGPYVESEVESLIKYKDLNKQTSYYYNMLAATNSYKYTYNHNLWTEIISVK